MALIGAAFLSFSLGSLHAFSLLLLAMEAQFGASRGAASMTYSIALVCLAAAVLIGHKLYARLRPATYVLMTGSLAAFGCTVAALATFPVIVWLGFGVIFGAANGLGYGYALQFAGQVLAERRGYAMGVITAAYALGAVVFPVPLRLALNSGGWSTALLFMAISVLFAALLSALLLARSHATYAISASRPDHAVAGSGRQILWYWLSYCGAVTAGLMAIAHATGLVAARHGNATWITAAPIVIAAANMAGSLSGGVMTDRIGGRSVLVWFALLSVITLLAMAIITSVTPTLIGLALVGMAYGGTIAAYPAYIAARFGQAAGTVVYGRVFTAWAAAGLLGPAVAGVLFDRYHDYRPALFCAALAAAASLVVLLSKMRNARHELEALTMDINKN